MKYLFAIFVLCCTAFAQSPWPGQSGNAVGYAAYGSLNATACGAFSSGSSWAARTTISNCKYSTAQTINCNYCEFDSVDFNAGVSGTLVSGSNVLFKGCRFQSNDVANDNVQTTGANIYFVFSSVTPLASFYTSPPGSIWPSAGAGANSTTITGGTNAVLGNEGYEYGINITSGGPVYITGADIWGFGNAVVFYSTTAQMTLVNSWMHDIADPSIESYHTDGPGYLNGSTGPTNVTIQGNTIAMLGNTNSLAFQQATGGYTGLQINSNYLSGNGYTIALCMPSTATGGSGVSCTGNFARNVFGSDIASRFGPLYSTGIGSNVAWTGNTIDFLAGTTWTAGSCTPTSGMNNQFFNPSSGCGNSSTDYNSNTHTGNLAPSSLLWLPSAANQQTITHTAGNTGNLASISISLATGTQFSQTNNCGTTLANAASCTITVTYAPTGTGPVVDTLKIANNDPSSPEIIPLLGIDAPTQTQASPSSCTPGSGTYSSTQHPACTNPNTGTTVQCYTINGTTPATNGLGTACTTGTLLSSGGTVTVSANVTLNIIAGTSTLADSPVTSYTYFIEASPATCSPTSGNVPQTVTCTNPNSGTTIACYNTTGSPATNGLGTGCAAGSTAYTTSLSVNSPETLYIVAGTSITIDSPINSYTYGAAANVAPAVGMFAQLELP
jgi:hypothetical protein